MDEINALAKRKGLIVIDDSARTIDGYYKNKAAGRLADITVFSFELKTFNNWWRGRDGCYR